MWTRRGHPSTTADAVLSWGEVLYRAGVMIAGLIIVLAAINCLYQISILEEPIIPVVPFVRMYRFGFGRFEKRRTEPPKYVP